MSTLVQQALNGATYGRVSCHLYTLEETFSPCLPMAISHQFSPTIRSPHHGRFRSQDRSVVSTISTKRLALTTSTSLPSPELLIQCSLIHSARDTTHTPSKAHNGHFSVAAVLPIGDGAMSACPGQVTDDTDGIIISRCLTTWSSAASGDGNLEWLGAKIACEGF